MKKIMNLQEVKDAVKKDENLLMDDRAFKRSDIFKTLKRGQLECEALVWLVNNTTHYDISSILLSRCSFDFKTAAKYGLIEVVARKRYWEDLFDILTDFFNSKEDFLDFVKETYGVTFEEEENTIIDSKDFRYFVKALMNNDGAMRFIKGRKAKNADLHREVYVQLVPYIYKLYKMTGESESDYVNIEETISRVWAAKFTDFIGIIDKLDINEEERIRLYLLIATRAIRYRMGKYFTDDEIVAAIAKVKEIMGDNFPLFPMAEETYTTRRLSHDFIEELCYLCSGYKTEKGELPQEHRETLYNDILEPLMTEVKYSGQLNRILQGYYESNFIQAVLNLTPQDKVDNNFNYFISKRSARTTVNSLVDLFNSSEKNKTYIKATERMTDVMLALDYNWDRLIIPEDKFYDMEYIENVCTRIGKNGEYNILFGGYWGGNGYTLSRLEPSKLPKEFFEKYDDTIDWDGLSRCHKLSIDFVKEHREKISYQNLKDKVCALLDEEIVGWVLEKYSHRLDIYSRANMKNSRVLSLPFLVKHMQDLYFKKTSGDKRGVFFKYQSPSLAEVVDLL